MKLFLPLLITPLLWTMSNAFLSKLEFTEFLGPHCFRNNEDGLPMANGQDHPSPQTLENFIALAEKLEAANPGLDIRDELFYFIREYTYNDLEFSDAGDLTRMIFRESNRELVEQLWEPSADRRDSRPQLQDPFTDDEKCSIFYSISHSIFLKFVEKKERFLFSPANRSLNGLVRDIRDFYPLESGVVSVRGSKRGVALGRVLVGAYIGLNNNRKRPIEDVKPFSQAYIELLPEMRTVDSLYQLTMTEVISLATWSTELLKRDRFAKDGHWIGVVGLDSPEKENPLCPTHYILNKDSNSTQSYSTLRGAADGLILGDMMSEIVNKRRDVKLSQLLRQYYSRGGFSLKGQWASFCNRQNWMEVLKVNIEQQVLLYQFLVGSNYRAAVNDAKYSMVAYLAEVNNALMLRGTDMNNYCTATPSVDDPKNLPLESGLDVYVVLDTNYGQQIFETQQRITAYLAQQLDLQYSGSRITVLLDRKAQRDSSGAVHLQEVANNTYFSGCTACNVSQLLFDEVTSNNGLTPEDEVILALDQLLQRKKDEEEKRNGVNGKVIVYFNFQEESRTSRPNLNQARVDKALQDLHTRHREVVVLALGRVPDLVKKYARRDSTMVLSALDETEDKVAKHLLEKITRVPANLQYEDCREARSESSAIYEDFVSRNAIQHWSMPAQYMYKSRGFHFTFESSNSAPIKVCYNRATVAPELEDKNCQLGNKIEIKDANPCQNFNQDTCAPLYFAVIGINSTEDTSFCTDNNLDNQCSTLDQIRFRVTHDGVRCSGSMGLLATPILIALLILFLKAH